MKLLSLIKCTFQGEEQEYRLIEKIQNECPQLGTQLGIEKTVIDGFDKKHLGDVKRICEDILHTWMQQGDDVTWNILLNALQDIRHTVAAKRMREFLECKYFSNLAK